MKIESNIKLFNSEKEAQAFIDKYFEIEAIAHEFTSASGAILWAICVPDAYESHDDDFATFYDEDGDYVAMHDVIFKETEG